MMGQKLEEIERFMRYFYNGLRFVCAVTEASTEPPVLRPIEWREGIDREAYYFFGDIISDDVTDEDIFLRYGVEAACTVDGMFFEADKEQRVILAKKILYFVAPALCCKYFKISDFSLILYRRKYEKHEKIVVNWGDWVAFNDNDADFAGRWANALRMFLNGADFLLRLGRIFTDYEIDIESIYNTMEKSVYIPGYELLPVGVFMLPGIEELDWRALCLKLEQANSIKPCGTSHGGNVPYVKAKAVPGATTKAQCDVLGALLRAGGFDMPDNTKFAAFISWLCGGTATNIRQRGFYGELSEKDIETIKEKCSLIGLKYERGRVSRSSC